MRRLFKTIRNVLVLVLLIVAALGGVLAYRTITHTSRQIDVAAIPRVDVDENAVSKRLAASIRHRTIAEVDDPDKNSEQFRALHAQIEADFPSFHAAVKREIVGGYSLLYTWQGTDASAKPIALLAHQDVVPIAPGTEKDWDVPPFDGVVKDGFIWGRGSWDDKGNMFAMLEAAEVLIKQGFKPKRTIYFAFGHDEEISGKRGAVAMAKLLQSRGVSLDFIFDEGLLITDGIIKGVNQPVALIGVAEKGYVTVEVSSTTTPGHSSLPPRDTAIGTLSAALARLESKPFPAAIRGVMRETLETAAPHMNLLNRVVLSNLWLLEPIVRKQLEQTPTTAAAIRTTTALTIFNAGNKENVLPGKADATVNFRLLPGETESGVIDHVHGAVGNDKIRVTPKPGNTNPPPVTTTNSDSYRALNRTIREVFPDVIVAPGLMVAATDSRNYIDITDKIYRFTPVRATNEDLKRFHGTNERLSVSNYADMIRFYLRLVQNTAQ
jgi:carboxypeptidase PM20D1